MLGTLQPATTPCGNHRSLIFRSSSLSRMNYYIREGENQRPSRRRNSLKFVTDKIIATQKERKKREREKERERERERERDRETETERKRERQRQRQTDRQRQRKRERQRNRERRGGGGGGKGGRQTTK